MTALVLEQLDLATRRTQEPELGGRDIRLVDHQRVELVQRLPLAGGLNDDETPVITEAAAAALAVEEVDQRAPLSLVAVALCRARSLGVLASLARGVPTTTCSCELSG